MTTGGAELPAEALRRLVRLLSGLGVRDFALTDSVALGFWSTPRETRDIDVCGDLPKEAIDPLLATHDGVRSGPGEVPDVVRFRVADWDVDFFVGRTEYDRACLQRSERFEVEGTPIRVVRPEDLLVHKLVKVRTDRRRLLQDLADVRAILHAQAGRLDWTYLDRWLPVAEAALLREAPSLDDEALVRRVGLLSG